MAGWAGELLAERSAGRRLRELGGGGGCEGAHEERLGMGTGEGERAARLVRTVVPVCCWDYGTAGGIGSVGRRGHEAGTGMR